MAAATTEGAAAPPPSPPRRLRRWRLCHSVEEGGATVLHRLAPEGASASAEAAWRLLGLVGLGCCAGAVLLQAGVIRHPAAERLLEWRVVSLVLGVGLMLLRRLILRRTVASESVLVVKGLGLQLQARFADGREEVAQFLDLDRVKAVIINEGFTMHRVVYYLAFLVEGRDDLVVAFPWLQPRLEELLPVYHGLRAVVEEAQAARACGQQHRHGQGLS